MMANCRWLGARHSGQEGSRSVAGPLRGSVKSMLRAIVVAWCLVTAAMLSKCGGGSSQQSVQPLAITTPSLPNGTVETPYSQPIQASGGVGPFSWSVTGTLPHNLGLSSSTTNNVTIFGTPDTAAQATAFSVKVTDGAKLSATQTYTVSILSEPDTLTLAPPSLSFAPQLIGTVSGAQVETITNTGSSSVSINSISIAPSGTNSADYSQTNTCGSILAAGANCAINVTLTPSQPGPRSASIAITDSTVGSPHSISLIGVGLTAGPNATLSATSLTFTDQAVNTTSPMQSITLSNYGTTTLGIASMAASANFSETDNCSGMSLASGANCTVNVTFTPNATGAFSGTISVTNNAPGSPQTVSLNGTGVTSQYTLTGACFHNIHGLPNCQFSEDSAECPAGQQARTPSIVGCFFPHNASVDLSRSCSVKGAYGGSGYCATSFTGAAKSRAAASGSGLSTPSSDISPKK